MSTAASAPRPSPLLLAQPHQSAPSPTLSAPKNRQSGPIRPHQVHPAIARAGASLEMLLRSESRNHDLRWKQAVRHSICCWLRQLSDHELSSEFDDLVALIRACDKLTVTAFLNPAWTSSRELRQKIVSASER